MRGLASHLNLQACQYIIFKCGGGGGGDESPTGVSVSGHMSSKLLPRIKGEEKERDLHELR